MLGICCDTNHPALAALPTEANCDWQWTEILNGARAMNLGTLPSELTPIVAAIDDWNRNWKLGLLYEAKVGGGRLLVCTLDINSELEQRPVARQLRRALLDYMASDRFQPLTQVAAQTIRDALFNTRIMRMLDADVAASSGNGRDAIDGDPNTFWSAGGRGRGGDERDYPHELTVLFPSPVAMDGLVLMNRQNDRNHLGDIRRFSLQLSDDGESWREVLDGELASTWNPQEIRFKETATARGLKFTALSSFGGEDIVALAELAVLHAGPSLGEPGDEVEYQRVRSTSTDVDEGGSATPANGNAQ
jgi:hypothetical protein